MKLKFDDVILQLTTKVTTFIILTFSLYLFFAGHYNPGGGFIGGLVTASAFVLLFLAFDIKTIRRLVPVDFKKVAAFGVLLAVLTGTSSLFYGAPFLNQLFGTFHLPILGETELATAVLFDVGVFFAVVGTAMTIVLSISEDG